MKKIWSVLLLMVLLMGHLMPALPALADEQAQPAPAREVNPDPSGVNTGGAVDVIGATSGAPTKDDMKKLAPNEPLSIKLADVVGHNRVAINFVWTLLCAYLVFFMQAGFAMVETGFTRAKNAANTVGMNLMVLVFGVLGYWICGFALQMGGSGAGPLAGGTGLLDG